MNCPSCGAFITQEASYCPECKRPVIKAVENSEQPSKPLGNQADIPDRRRRRLRLQKAEQEDIKPSSLFDNAPTLPIENLSEQLSSSASASRLDEAPTSPIEKLLDHAPTVPTESISPDASDMPTRPVASMPPSEQPDDKRQEELPAPPVAVRAVFSSARLVTRAAIAAPRPVRSSRQSSMTIVLLCLAVLLVGGVAAGAAFLRGTVVTLPPSVLDGSPTPIEGPSGQVIDLNAGAIINNVNLASKIDDNYLPLIATTTFAPGQRVYLTFVVNSQNRPGDIMVKWYADKHLRAEDQIAHNPQDNVAFFSYIYDQPADATAELYWCSTASCSDARLAHIILFTVR
ncbi:MAG TPA: hypothetical protein VH593_07310 [Ktedonobacteraceae bacterium]